MKSTMSIIKRYKHMTHLSLGLCFLVIGISTVDRWNLARSIQEGPRFVVVDDTTFMFPRSFVFQDAHTMHREQAVLAATTLLSRSPSGIDNRDRLEALYHPDAFDEAMKLVNRDDPVFQAKSIHQKATVAETRLLHLSNQAVKTSVIGQLLRVGLFEDETVVEVLDFELSSHFVLNPNAVQNGRYPTIVSEFKLKIKPSSL